MQKSFLSTQEIIRVTHNTHHFAHVLKHIHLISPEQISSVDFILDIVQITIVTIG